MNDQTLCRAIAYELLLGKWFEAKGWAVTREGEFPQCVVALLSSGYGSGPAEINISELAEHLSKYDVTKATIKQD